MPSQNKVIHNFLKKQRANEKVVDIKKSEAPLDDKINHLQTLVDNTRNDVKDIYSGALSQMQNMKAAEEKKARETVNFDAPEQSASQTSGGANNLLSVAFDTTYNNQGTGLARAVGENRVGYARQLEETQRSIAMARKVQLLTESESASARPVAEEYLAPVSKLGRESEKKKKKLGGGL